MVNFLSKNFEGLSLHGVDISGVAIERARNNFPEHHFMVGDIGSSEFLIEPKYDVVIFNQILWYILGNLETAIFNAHRMLNAGGHFVISNGYLKEQRYGSDIVDGFKGCKKFMEIHCDQLFSLIGSQLDQSGNLVLNDGILVYRKVF